MTRKLWLILVLLAAATPYVHSLRAGSGKHGTPPLLESIPQVVDGYSGFDLALDPEEIKVLGSDETLYRFYTHQDLDNAWLFLGYFSSSRENSQIHSPKHCYPGSGWEIYAEGAVKLDLAGRTTKVKKLYITNGDYQRVVYYWFVTSSGVITGEYNLKWDQMKNALSRKSLSAMFIRFSAEREGNEPLAETEVKLKRFVETMYPYIDDVLKQSLWAD
jgi:EpsI family protein